MTDHFPPEVPADQPEKQPLERPQLPDPQQYWQGPPQFPQQQPWTGPPGPQFPMQAGRKRRHRVRNTVLAVLGVIVLISIIASVTGGGDSGKKAGHAAASSPTAGTSSAVPQGRSYSAAEMNFFYDFQTSFPSVQSSDANLAGLAHSVCGGRRAGGSQKQLVATAVGKFGHAGAAKLIRLAEKDVCPAMVPHKPKVIARFSGTGIQNTARFRIGRSGDWLLRWSYDCSSFGQSGNFIVSEDGGSDFGGASVNELGSGGHGKTHAYNDAGRHYLAVDSECSWSVDVVQ